jgi:hypothetical protein
MAKKPGQNNSVPRDNLLARLLNLFYVIPPAVNKTPGASQQSLMLRLSFPVPLVQRSTRQASDLRQSKQFTLADLPLKLSTCSAAPTKSLATAISFEKSCAEHGLSGCPFSGSGEGESECSCCTCKCDCCRKRAREWLLPRSERSLPDLRQASGISAERLALIRNPGDCVLGVLASGYVLRGSGFVKGRAKKRA